MSEGRTDGTIRTTEQYAGGNPEKVIAEARRAMQQDWTDCNQFARQKISLRGLASLLFGNRNKGAQSALRKIGAGVTELTNAHDSVVRIQGKVHRHDCPMR